MQKISFRETFASSNAVQPGKIIMCQSIGFLAIIIVCLLDESLGLSSLVMGDHAYIIDFRGFTLKMLLILCVWLLVSNSTRRIMDQAQHLATFMKVCAWCRRIQFQGRWMPLEKFFKLGFNKTTSHGICADCLLKARAEINHEASPAVESAHPEKEPAD